ncbi:MAG: hypothetical protein R3F07_02200 [Opitutaceae bacterium]
MISIFGFVGISVIPVGADCLKPVLNSVFPPELPLGVERELASVTLFGEDLGFDPVWQNPGESSRCHSQVWVRRKDGREDSWVVAAEDAGLEAEGVVLGEGSQGWVRVDFHNSDWWESPGSLEFVVIRGSLRTDGTLLETGRSDVREIPIVGSISYRLTVDSVTPPAVPPGSPPTIVTLKGLFTWETEVWMDGRIIPDASVHPGHGTVRVKLSADQLTRPGRVTFLLRDSAGAVSQGIPFHIEEPTRITKISPKELKTSRVGQTVKVRFEGAEPERAEFRFQPEVRQAPTATAPQLEDFSEGFSKGKQVRSESVEAGSILTVWRSVEFVVRKNEVRFPVDSEYLPAPGALIIRLSGRTGEQAAVIPVVGEGATILLTPTPSGGPPEMDHRFSDRPKY